MHKTSQDAYLLHEGNTFRIGDSRVEKTLEMREGGSLVMAGYTNKLTGRQYVSGRQPSDEFALTFNGKLYAGASGGWELVDVAAQTLAQGELEAIITLQNDVLKVFRHYVAYPGTGVIQEWTEYENLSGAEATINRPRIFVERLLDDQANSCDLGYMTGAANFSGSTLFKTVALVDGYTKDFDSQGAPEMMAVDGVFVNKCHPRFNGAGIWMEFFVLRDRVHNEGWYLTFDYQGWWKAQFSSRDGNTALIGWCELIDYALKAGERLKMPPMMSGVFTGDIDDLGNTINEYIYAYKWDYTRDRYFNRSNIIIWREAPLAQRVFKMVEIGRYIGAERLWVDDFWFDAKGNWNGVFGDDWRRLNAYINRHGMSLRLWMPPWHADRLSQIWLEHPEWMLDFHGNWYNWTIDMSREEAYQWILNMLCDMQTKIGAYDLRVDGDPCNVRGHSSFDSSDQQGDWNGVLLQSHNFYRLYKEFKDHNPEAGLDGCSSGGHTLTIEAVRYTDQQQITDGECKHYGGYWTTLLMPIDKHQGMPIAGRPRHGAQSQQLFSAPHLMTQNPEQGYSQQALESIRRAWELFYWLRAQGVYGRWIKVYRPLLEYGDPTFIMQRMTWDHHKGLVMISGDELNPILGKSAVIYPKGLLPDERYTIESLQGGMPTQTKVGARWMREGIRLEHVKLGENLLINLPGRPGQGADAIPPTRPGAATKEQARWIGHDGVGVSWGASEDNVMVSHYEIYKNGEPFTKVSVGTYLFDETGRAEDEYQIRAVDGDGNTSEFVTAR